MNILVWFLFIVFGILVPLICAASWIPALIPIVWIVYIALAILTLYWYYISLYKH